MAYRLARPWIWTNMILARPAPVRAQLSRRCRKSIDESGSVIRLPTWLTLTATVCPTGSVGTAPLRRTGIRCKKIWRQRSSARAMPLAPVPPAAARRLPTPIPFLTRGYYPIKHSLWAHPGHQRRRLARPGDGLLGSPQFSSIITLPYTPYTNYAVHVEYGQGFSGVACLAGGNGPVAMTDPGYISIIFAWNPAGRTSVYLTSMVMACPTA